MCLRRGSWPSAVRGQNDTFKGLPLTLTLSPQGGRGENGTPSPPGEGEGRGEGGGHEHLSLSRLQHTHIVPLHSVHEFSERGLRGLCQPYFGGATLAELLRRLKHLPAHRRSGRDLL